MSEEPRPGSLASRLTDNPTVLVVEDEADIAAFLGAYFRASGLALEHVDPRSVVDVDRAMTRWQPSCVLLDLHLRGLSGLDVYRHLRANPANALVPVIIVTADTRAAVRDEAMRGGVDGFVAKPFNVKQLFALVETKVASARMRADATATPATADVPTGVGTRTFVHDRLSDEIGIASHVDRPVAFGLVRVRSLKDTNRQLGYGAGDVVLRTVANRLVTSFPSTATVGRSAGAEFAVVLPGVTPDDASAALADALASATLDVDVPTGGLVPVSLSAGVAGFPAHGKTADEVYMAADVALAEACERDESVALAR